MDIDHIIGVVANLLYHRGWRARDRDELMQDYAFTEEEADAIVTKLAFYQRWERQEAE